MSSPKPLYAGVRKVERGWQGFVRYDDGSDEITQATRTRWEAVQLAQRLHATAAYHYRQSRDS